MWTLQGTWSMQAALLLPPPRPEHHLEAPGKDNVNDTPVVMLHEVRVVRLFRLLPSTQPKGTTTVVTPGLG